MSTGDLRRQALAWAPRGSPGPPPGPIGLSFSPGGRSGSRSSAGLREQVRASHPRSPCGLNAPCLQTPRSTHGRFDCAAGGSGPTCFAAGGDPRASPPGPKGGLGTGPTREDWEPGGRAFAEEMEGSLVVSQVACGSSPSPRDTGLRFQQRGPVPSLLSLEGAAASESAHRVRRPGADHTEPLRAASSEGRRPAREHGAVAMGPCHSRRRLGRPPVPFPPPHLQHDSFRRRLSDCCPDAAARAARAGGGRLAGVGRDRAKAGRSGGEGTRERGEGTAECSAGLPQEWCGGPSPQRARCVCGQQRVRGPVAGAGRCERGRPQVSVQARGVGCARSTGSAQAAGR
jgi:hypothetical protein